MDKKATSFAVYSKGYCFLCLNKISSQFPPIVKIKDTLDASSPTSVYSLQEISRYLKIDMGKVFIQGGPVPPQLLAKVEKSNLKVELCEECATMTESISRQCRQLKKLKMVIESSLQSVHEKMSEAESMGRNKRFREAAGSAINSGLGDSMEILEVLRLETMQKCSLEISKASPRLQIQRLAHKEIKIKTFRIPKNKVETSSKRMLHSGLPSNSINIDESDTANWPLEENDPIENSFTNDWDNDANDPISTIVNDESEPAHVLNDENNLRRKWKINSETGKYKCQICTMEYASTGAVHNHYNSVHRQVRYKCKICGKEFTHKFNYTRHHRNAHAGVQM